jgi:hypothetical protein
VLRTLPSQPIGIFYINTHGLLDNSANPPASGGLDPDDAPPPTGIGGMWTSEVLDVNNTTLFAPDPTLGEDYLPIITSSG